MRVSFLNRLRKAKGLKTRPSRKNIRDREKEFDRIADHFTTHCNIDRIFDELKLTLWHKNILHEREKKLKAGKDKFVDWEKAKNQLRNNL
jgi:hypothetical protein